MIQKQQYLKYLARSQLFHPNERQKSVDGSSFCSAFLNWEITGPYKFLLKLIWKTPFLKMLHWIICYKNENIGNIWQEVRYFIQMKDRNRLMKAPSVFLFLIAKLQNFTFLLKTNLNIDFIKFLHRLD